MPSPLGHGATWREEVKQQARIPHWELSKDVELKLPSTQVLRVLYMSWVTMVFSSEGPQALSSKATSCRQTAALLIFPLLCSAIFHAYI